MLRKIIRNAAKAADPITRPVSRSVNRAFNRPIGTIDRQSPLHPLGAYDRIRGIDQLNDKVAGKTVMVTGASSGIGEASAIRLAEAGATVLLVARSADKLAELKKRLDQTIGTAEIYPADLSDAESLDAMIAKVIKDGNEPDILVNNAGHSIRRSVENSYDRIHDYERTMQLNYFGALRLILGFLPGMRERKSGQIINISSAGVQTRTPRFSAYIASKAALDAFSDSVQSESLDDGIRFTTIFMPLVRTPMIAPTKIYKRFPTLTPEQAAQLIAEAVIYRPRRLAPPFGYIASFADALSPDLMDNVRNRGYKMFPESGSRPDPASEDGSDPASASQDDPVAEEGEVGTTGQAFARATRGVHW